MEWLVKTRGEARKLVGKSMHGRKDSVQEGKRQWQTEACRFGHALEAHLTEPNKSGFLIKVTECPASMGAWTATSMIDLTGRLLEPRRAHPLWGPPPWAPALDALWVGAGSWLSCRMGRDVPMRLDFHHFGFLPCGFKRHVRIHRGSRGLPSLSLNECFDAIFYIIHSENSFCVEL